MTRGKYSVVALVTILVLVSSNTSASAQKPIPPNPNPNEYHQMHPTAIKAGISPAAASTTPALGPSGTSFRYVNSLGTPYVPYFDDSNHLFQPNGLYIDSSNSVYVVEEGGARLLKYDSTGGIVWKDGKAGVTDWTTDPTIQFSSPKDVTADKDGKIWVVDNDHVSVFNPDGSFVRILPNEFWNINDQNYRFWGLRGIAFDQDGHLYLADEGRHRIQVFSIDSQGEPQYEKTIGITDTPGDSNTQFSNPGQIAIDSHHNVFVSDSANHRVQKCAPDGLVWPWNWTCTTFLSGDYDGTDIGWVKGLFIDSSDNLYVTDPDSWRVVKCTSAGSCVVFMFEVPSPLDIAMDSSGKIYVSEDLWGNSDVEKFSETGSLIGVFAGTPGVPYLTDNQHFNHPRGIDVDTAGNIYIAEEQGQRLIKINSTGTVQTVLFGEAGIPGAGGDDKKHLCYPHDVALAPDGSIYVAGGCNTVRVLKPDGSFLADLNQSWGGSGDFEFSTPYGVDVDRTGKVYVADTNNNRVQIYSSDRTRLLGAINPSRNCGSGDNQLCGPMGVTVDQTGNIYVSDTQNCRVQKYDASLVYKKTFGHPDGCGDGQGQLSWASDVAVDAQGKVYVSDENHQNVVVYDADGGYLTTIGGTWGTNTSQFMSAGYIALDNNGNLYVSDWTNDRIQKFAPGDPSWKQANLNGFGQFTGGWVMSLAVFKDQLYAAGGDWSTTGLSQIFKSSDGVNWTRSGEAGFGADGQLFVIAMTVFNNQLYASTGWSNATPKIYRTTDGNTWNAVVDDGFGNPNTQAISSYAVFQNKLYVGVQNDTDGASIERSDTGNAGTWTPVVTGGNGNPQNTMVDSFTVYKDALYASVENGTTGMVVWQTTDGMTWKQVNENGFGDPQDIYTSGFAIFNNTLYVGTATNGNGLGKIWSTTDGKNWSPVISDGFGDPNNMGIDYLYAFSGKLYVVTDNSTTGMEVWGSGDGSKWTQINNDGFGDSNNVGALWANSAAEFNGHLFIGTRNNANGPEIWQYTGYQTYLPLTKRS